MHFFLQTDYFTYGIDWGGPVPSPTHDEVEVPETRCPIDLDGLQSLSRFYPPQDAPINDVIDLFIRSVEHVNELLSLQRPV